MDAWTEEKEEQGTTGVVNSTLCESNEEEPLKPSTVPARKKETMSKPSSTVKYGVAKQAKIMTKVELSKDVGVNKDEARELVKDPKVG